MKTFWFLSILLLGFWVSASEIPLFTAENTDNLGGMASVDGGRSWPGIVFEQDGGCSAEVVEAIVHFEPIDGNLDVEQHRFELLIFREDAYWRGEGFFTKIELGGAPVTYDCEENHCLPSEEFAVGTTGEERGNETTYRLRWKLPEKDNPLNETGKYVVVLQATHGETAFGAAKLTYAKADQALSVPVRSVEGNVRNRVDREVLFGQEPDDLVVGFALVGRQD